MTEAASLSAAGTPFSLPRFSSGGAKFVEHFFVRSSIFLLKSERFCAILDNRENCVQKHIGGGNQNCMERRRSVLLAGANEEFRTMLRDAMEETGLFAVELACNGHEVLERIHAHEPELLVLDPALPGMDGIRVLRQLRREGCASEIFLISAFVSDHMLAEATELRVDYFLPKPFAFEALFDRMRGAAAQSARSALHPPSLLVTSILHELGMSPGLKGYGYIHDAALLALDDPSLLHAVTKVIYPCVARRNGTTAFCVERAIRHAIEITWERGSRDAWDRYFGYLCADGGKPANGMFLAELVEALKYEKLG